MQKRSRIISITGMILVVIIAAAGTYIGLRFLKAPEHPDIVVLFPGEASEGMDRSSEEPSDLMRIAVLNKSMSGGMLSDHLLLPYSTTERELERSGRYLFADQVEMLSFFAEKGDRKAYRSLLDHVIA